MKMTLRSLRKENRRRIEQLVPEDRDLLLQIREYFERRLPQSHWL